jgi:hypothetical protein
MSHPIEQASLSAIESAVSLWPLEWRDAWRRHVGIFVDNRPAITVLVAFREAYTRTLTEAAAEGVTLRDGVAQESKKSKT